MNHAGQSPWSQPEQVDHSLTMQDLDFAAFLDIGDIDLTDFPPLDQDLSRVVQHSQHAQHAQQPPNSPFDAEMQGIQASPAIYDFAADPFNMDSAISHNQMTNTLAENGAVLHNFQQSMGQSMWNEQRQQHQQHQQHQQTQHSQPHHYSQPSQMQDALFQQQRNQIPPTPNSYEMHGDSSLYLEQQMDAQTRTFFDQLKNDAFTPLVSPAVTPQDSQFQSIPEYTVPGAYFSPLTSPAIQAQNAAQHQRQAMANYTNPSTTSSSVATSPLDLNFDVDMLSGAAVSLPSPARRASKRKPQAPRSVATSSARLRQSPIVKPMKRKSTAAMTAKDVDSMLRDTPHPRTTSATHARPATATDSSSAESASPRPWIADTVMGPPPKPRSTLNSPAIAAQSHSAPASVSGNTAAAPATPASLMSMENSPQLSQGRHPHSANPPGRSHGDAAMLDDFVLPPSATSSAATDSDATPVASTNITPRLAARKTPKLSPFGTNSGSSMSTSSSPAMRGLTSPAFAATPGKTLKGNKRGSSISSGSVMISPALRPRISPSIKPLLPEGGLLSDSQHALLLASKSNYTHLLEGTLLPGVSYPESLSSGLTSKRTSHKIAEQGRRNRINDALKEMQSLLPSVASKPESGSNGTAAANDGSTDDNESSKDGASKSSPKTAAAAAAAAQAASDSKSANSKAATVESAIEYIKILKHERLQTVQMLKRQDEEMAALRKRLVAAEAKLGAPEAEKSGDVATEMDDGGVGAEAGTDAESAAS